MSDFYAREIQLFRFTTVTNLTTLSYQCVLHLSPRQNWIDICEIEILLVMFFFRQITEMLKRVYL